MSPSRMNRQLKQVRRRVRASFKRSLAVLKGHVRLAPEASANGTRALSNEVERQRVLDGVLAALRQLTRGIA